MIAIKRTARVVLCVGAALASGHAQLGAQARRDAEPSRFDFAFGVTLNDPKDVNIRPQCTDLGLPCGSPRTFPDFGLTVQAAAYVGAHLAVVAEAGTYLNRWDTVGVNTPASARENHESAFLVGARLMSPEYRIGSKKDSESYRIFMQVLGGPEASTVVPTRFAVQPGAGIDVKLSIPDMWFRVGGDYRWTRGGPRNLSGDRGFAALVVAQ